MIPETVKANKDNDMKFRTGINTNNQPTGEENPAYAESSDGMEEIEYFTE